MIAKVYDYHTTVPSFLGAMSSLEYNYLRKLSSYWAVVQVETEECLPGQVFSIMFFYDTVRLVKRSPKFSLDTWQVKRVIKNSYNRGGLLTDVGYTYMELDDYRVSEIVNEFYYPF